MSPLSFLPSAQFVLMVVSIGLSLGLVVAAERFTRQENTARIAPAEVSAPAELSDWQRQLEEIQALSGLALPEPPDEEAYLTLLEAAQSPNITESVSRSLLINLSNASAQGLGSDLPTQEQLVAQALEHLPTGGGVSYMPSDLSVAVDSKETLRSYGNAVMVILQSYPAANAGEALRAVGLAVDQDDMTHFKKLISIREAYQAIALELLALPVPQTLSPLHLAIVNNFSAMVAALADAEATPTDPLRGLVGLQRYQLLLEESERVFTTIAQQLNSSAILFNKDEPGNAWGAFLSALSQPST